MSDEQKGLEASADAVGRMSGVDRLSAGSAALIDGIPIVGPLLAEGHRQLAPNDADLALRDFARHVAKRFVELDESKVDREYLESEEFTAAFAELS